MRVAATVLLLLVALPAQAQRAAAEVACKPAGKELTYDCAIKLTDTATGKPIDRAKITVGAYMPSMPMAHNLRPVAAKPGPVPGEYAVQLVLEMHGEWALKLRVTGPVNDQIVTRLRFE